MSKIDFYVHKLGSQAISDLAGTYPAAVIVLKDRTVWRLTGTSATKEIVRTDRIKEMESKTKRVLEMYDNLTKSADIAVVVFSDHAVRKETILKQLDTAQGRLVA